MTNFIPCAFINLELPVKIGDWTGFYVKKELGSEISLYGSRDYFYKHPEAPNDAVLQVYRNEHIITVKPGDKEFPNIYLLLHAQMAVEQMVKEKT